MPVYHYLLKSVATHMSLKFPLISVELCQHWKLLKRMYPLHDQEALEKLGKKWYRSLFGKQPLGESSYLCALSLMKLKMLLKWELYICNITTVSAVRKSAAVGCRYIAVVCSLEVNPSYGCINITFPRLSTPSFIGRFSFPLIDDVITALDIKLLLSYKCN